MQHVSFIEFKLLAAHMSFSAWNEGYEILQGVWTRKTSAVGKETSTSVLRQQRQKATEIIQLVVSVNYWRVNYMNSGYYMAPPPVIVSSCQWLKNHMNSGKWCISLFESAPIIILIVCMCHWDSNLQLTRLLKALVCAGGSIQLVLLFDFFLICTYICLNCRNTAQTYHTK